jgi:hypothetical protein
MSIERDGKAMQICCDSCPASFPETFEADAFREMIAAAKSAGWRIEKRKAATGRDRDTTDLFGKPPQIATDKAPEPYTHTCPSCVRGEEPRRLL